MTEDNRSRSGYLATLVIYAITVVAVAVLGRLTHRKLPEAMCVQDLVTTAFAAHKLSRTVTKDAVVAPLRAPFTRPAGDGGPGEVMERPKADDGVAHSIGQLLTCPFCFDVWVVTGFTVGHVFAPRTTRMIGESLAVLAGADFLHLAYATAQRIAEK
ncbi:DUF1360 domain-containing protein [Nocardia bhagyanarayanae]|uniref:Uncharacterized protein DUF1360 n=1 Tax=Nocardia bhagyanarayanae TaxID=1215925 RepID=A0A543FE47_9NOCA|nr:DUF1360 domain-containing protein [Nocardia bhagyanarayanae]TQM32031.1 uncharacterized protein DUF1360 [Nocardia bhagyanarayanae]